MNYQAEEMSERKGWNSMNGSFKGLFWHYKTSKQYRRSAMIISPQQSIGNIVQMKTSHPLHFSDREQVKPNDDVAGSFADTLKTALGKVNTLLVDSSELGQKMIHEPESVDIHNVMIAAQKAEIAINFTKAVRDEAIKAYRDLINLR
jgi:flagellar hook-basal body complex protein FliE